MREPRCHRLIQGHSSECPAAYGTDDLDHWCPVCLEAYDRWIDEQAERARLEALAEGTAPLPEEPPPPPPAEGPSPAADDPPPYLCPSCGL